MRRNRFTVVVRKWADPALPIYVPYTSLEEAVRLEGNSAEVYDLNGRLLWDYGPVEDKL